MEKSKRAVLSEYLVYLIGPITGTTWGEATDWRDFSSSKFPPHIIGLSPLRAKQYLVNESKIKDSYEEHALSSKRGIYVRDRNDCMRCDGMLALMLGAQKVSIGSVMEIAWGHSRGIPVVIVMEENNIHQHAMLCEGTSIVVPTLEEGIRTITALVSPR